MHTIGRHADIVANSPPYKNYKNFVMNNLENITYNTYDARAVFKITWLNHVDNLISDMSPVTSCNQPSHFE